MLSFALYLLLLWVGLELLAGLLGIFLGATVAAMKHAFGPTTAAPKSTLGNTLGIIAALLAAVGILIFIATHI